MEPDNAAANFNLGLLLGESKGRLAEAEQALRTALEGRSANGGRGLQPGRDPGREEPRRGDRVVPEGARLRPADPKYAHTLAFYLRKKGDAAGGIAILMETLQRDPSFIDAYLLLADIHEQQGEISKAVEVYRSCLRQEDLPAATRRQLEAKLQSLLQNRGSTK